MKRKTWFIPVCFLTMLFAASPAAGQPTNRWIFHVGAGFTEPVRYSSDRLNRGFNANVGAGVNFLPEFGLVGEFGFNHLGLSRGALAAAGVPDGSGRIYSLTANPIFRFNPRGRFDAYVIGGGGYYRRTVEFTAPTVTSVTAFDPYWGVFYPAVVPANAVLGSFSQNKAGLNAGGGVSVRLTGDSETKFFAETRYHYLYTTPLRTTILPVTFGLRW